MGGRRFDRAARRRVALCASAGVDEPGVSDAAILERLDDGARQTAAGIGLPVLGVGIALLLWFAVGLRRVLDRLSGGDPLAHVTVPAAALLGGLLITGVSLDVSSAVTAWSDELTPDPDTARVLGTAGLVVALTGLTGGAALVAATTRIAQQARALPTWAVWLSYAVAVLCLSGFWSGGMASVAFALWLIGAVIGVLRAARRAPPTPAVPALGAPAPEAAGMPPTPRQLLPTAPGGTSEHALAAAQAQASASRSRVSVSSCGRVRVRPMIGMKFWSPPQRGTTCWCR